MGTVGPLQHANWGLRAFLCFNVLTFTVRYLHTTLRLFVLMIRVDWLYLPHELETTACLSTLLSM